MIQRVRERIKAGIEPQRILDIGSGRQSLEKQLLMTYGKNPVINNYQIVTMDVADIMRSRLLAHKYPNVGHVQADALSLPFDDDSIGLVVSNLAIDFLPHQTFSEVARVLSTKGTALFNFHHPILVDKPAKDPQVVQFWNYLRTNKILFESADQITMELLNRGLKVEAVNLETDGFDKWWSVTATKISNPTQSSIKHPSED